MKKPYDYVILSAHTKKEMVSAVLRFHEEGYVCLGGVSVCRNENVSIYEQAMERQERTVMTPEHADALGRGLVPW